MLPKKQSAQNSQNFNASSVKTIKDFRSWNTALARPYARLSGAVFQDQKLFFVLTDDASELWAKNYFFGGLQHLNVTDNNNQMHHFSRKLKLWSTSTNFAKNFKFFENFELQLQKVRFDKLEFGDFNLEKTTVLRMETTRNRVVLDRCARGNEAPIWFPKWNRNFWASFNLTKFWIKVEVWEMKLSFSFTNEN